jgi:hypothetical protein
LGKKKKFGVLVRTPRTRAEQPVATKLRQEGPNVERIIDLADDFIGGFAPSKTDDQDVGEGVLVKRNGLWQPIVSPSPWVRRWGRIDVWVERFGRSVLWHAAPKQWAAEQPRECALIYNNLRCHDAEQRGRSAKRQRAFEDAIFFKPAPLEKSEAHSASPCLKRPRGFPTAATRRGSPA